MKIEHTLGTVHNGGGFYSLVYNGNENQESFFTLPDMERKLSSSLNYSFFDHININGKIKLPAHVGEKECQMFRLYLIELLLMSHKSVTM